MKTFTFIYRIIPILLILFLQQNTSQAEDAVSKSGIKKWHDKKRFAFLVGINKYQNTTELKYAVSDSREMFKLFSQVGHFEKIFVLNDKDGKVIIANGKEESRDRKYLPTKKNIEDTYKSILAEKPDTLLFYYSGHGFIDGKDDKNSIAPMDVEVNFVGEKAIPKNGIVLTEMANGFKTDVDKDKSEIEQVIFLIDACRSPLPKADEEEESGSNKKELGKDKKTITDKNELPKEANDLTGMNPDKDKLKTESEHSTSASENETSEKSKFISFQNYGEEIPEIVNDARGVVILIGTSPNEASLEDEDLQSGKFTYYIRKAISGGIQDETPAEYVTLESLELYVKKKFDLEQEEYARIILESGEFVQSKPAQAVYKVSTQRGFTGDFLISYGRPPSTQVRVERRGYLDLTEERPVAAKVLFNKNQERYDLKFFAKSKDSEKYYPESLEGVSRLKYNFYRNKNKDLTGFEAEQFNFKEESVFTLGLELEEESGWELNSIFPLTKNEEENLQTRLQAKETKDSTQRIRFQRQKFDFNGNNILQEYFDENGNPVAIGNAGITKTIRAWDYNGEKTLEEFYNAKGELTNNEKGYARYSASYLEKGKPISEEYFGSDGILSGNETGISRKTYTYDSGHKLVSKKSFDKEGNLIGDKDEIAVTNYTYNNACVDRALQIELTPSTGPDGEQSLTTTLSESYENSDAKAKSELIEKFKRNASYLDCIASEIYLDKIGNPTENSIGIARKENQFSKNGLRIMEQSFRRDERPWHNGGIFRTVFTYDDKNRKISKKFFGETRNTKFVPVPVTDNLGIHEYKYEYGNSSRGKYRLAYKRELLQRVLYLGIRGKLVSAAKGVSIEEHLYTYDRETKDYNQAVIHYLDSKGNFVRANKSNAQIQIEDHNKNILIVENLDNAQKLKNYWGGNIAYYTYKYDQNGNLIEYEIFGEDGNRVEWNGIAKYIYKYNAKGNLIREETFSAKETLTGRKIYKLDGMGNTVAIENYDLNGMLKEDAFGIAKYKYQYNANGKNILFELYGVNGKLKGDMKHGIAKYKYQYDLLGNIILLESYDEDKKLKNDSAGIARYVYKYDTKGNKLLEEYFDAKEQLTNYSSSFARIVYNYDDKGNRILLESFNAEGDKKEIQKISYDKLGNAILLENYNGEGKLTSHSVLNYDSNGNIILLENYGADNKLLQFDNSDTAKMEYLHDNKARETIEKIYTPEWKKIQTKLQEASKEDEFLEKNQTIEKQISFWKEKFTNTQYDFMNRINNSIGKEKGRKLYNDFEDFERKFIKKLENCILRKVSYKADETLVERKERLDRYRPLTSEKPDESGVLTSPEYNLYFKNPRGQFEKRLLHIKLDRFYRPVGLEFAPL